MGKSNKADKTTHALIDVESMNLQSDEFNIPNEDARRQRFRGGRGCRDGCGSKSGWGRRGRRGGGVLIPRAIASADLQRRGRGQGRGVTGGIARFEEEE